MDTRSKVRPAAIRGIATAASTAALMAGFALHGTAASVTNLAIKNIEITQAVQCLDQSKGYTTCPDNALELDTRRAAAVRVYIQHDGACSSDVTPFEAMVKAATVKIAVIVSHDPTGYPGAGELPFTAEKTFDVPCTTDLSKLRDDEHGSATFIIPADKLAVGGKREFVWIEAEIVPPAGMVDTDPTDNKKAIQAGGKDAQGKAIPGGFVPRNPLSVGWTMVYYKPHPSTKFPPYGGPPTGCDLSNMPDCPIYGYAEPTLKELYPGRIDYYMAPAGYLIYGTYNKQTNAWWGLPDIRDDGSAALLEQLEKMKKAPEFWFGAESPRAFIGWLPTGSHAGADFIGTGGIVAESEVYNNAPETLAHEVGHIVNISHPYEPGTCWPFDSSSDGFGQGDIREAGFRMSKGVPIRANSSDFMVQNTPYDSSGISPFHWGVLGKEAEGTWIGGDIRYSTYWAKQSSNCAISTLGASTGQSSSILGFMTGSQLAAPAMPQPALLVSGRVLADGTAVVSPFYRATSSGPFLESDPSGAYCLDLYGSGPLLASTCFNPNYARASDGTEQPVGTFVFQVPFPAGAQTAVVRQGTTELVRKTVSSTIPGLVITAPTAGSQFSEQMEVAWKSSTLGTDTLFSMVLYSRDGGVSYYPLAFDLEGSDFRIDIDSRLLPGSDTASIRIVTTDGLNTVAADSALFKVARKAPVVRIEAPAGGTTFNARTDILLVGSGTDLEDGLLGDTNLTWRDEAGLLLGSGRAVVLSAGTLAPGTHTITLTGKDSSGSTSTDSVTFTLYQQLYIDIKPGGSPNSINATSEGVIRVAILSSPAFFAPVDVVRSSLKFGKTGSEASLVRCSDEPVDADHDGIRDLICMFSTHLAGFDCASREGILSGRTRAGTPVGGHDFVRIVPSCGK
jgi:hypothetical protein